MQYIVNVHNVSGNVKVKDPSEISPFLFRPFQNLVVSYLAISDGVTFQQYPISPPSGCVSPDGVILIVAFGFMNSGMLNLRLPSTYMIELSSSFLHAAAAIMMTAVMIIDFNLQRPISLPSVFVYINCKYGDFNPKNRYLCTNTLPKGFNLIKIFVYA